MLKTAKTSIAFLMLLTFVLLPAGRTHAQSTSTPTPPTTSASKTPKPAPTPPPIATDDEGCCNPDECVITGGSPEPPC
jgi:hypothetical protein